MRKLLNDKFIPSERHFFDGCFWDVFYLTFDPFMEHF